MTAGKIPPNSISLLESEKMQRFISELRESEEFDVIILDCPPILGLSDALIISKYVDATVLTLSMNNVRKNLAIDCLQKIKQTKTPIIGTIVNSVFKESKKTLFDDGYYSYSNQYNYYSYKYMPEETQNRYQNEFDTPKENIVNSKETLQGKSLLEKAKTLLNKFKQWINE